MRIMFGHKTGLSQCMQIIDSTDRAHVYHPRQMQLQNTVIGLDFQFEYSAHTLAAMLLLTMDTVRAAAHLACSQEKGRLQIAFTTISTHTIPQGLLFSASRCPLRLGILAQFPGDSS